MPTHWAMSNEKCSAEKEVAVAPIKETSRSRMVWKLPCVEEAH